MLTSGIGIVGLNLQGDLSTNVIDVAYDVLGLEALFLVPRIFSLLSLNPYFGTLVSDFTPPVHTLRDVECYSVTRAISLSCSFRRSEPLQLTSWIDSLSQRDG